MHIHYQKELYSFYKSNPEVLEDMISSSRFREVAYMFSNGNFGKRPFYLEDSNDILDLVKRGVVSFHNSVERWYNPLALSTKLKRKELNELRLGWDLLLDIDSKDFDIAKYAAYLIISLLTEEYSLDKIYIKFSGGTGFHIIVPWERFPEEIEIEKSGEIVSVKTKNLFPDIARTVSAYIMYNIENKLQDYIEKFWDILELIEKYNLNIREEQFSPFYIVQIDSIAISPRHLFRMVYSLNEKSGKLSIPLKPSQILNFTTDFANLNSFIYEGIPFLTEEIERKDKMSNLIYDAIAWEKINYLEKERLKSIYELERYGEEKIEEEHRKIAIKRFKGKVPIEYFPPCIKNILNGLEDGRKRAVFVLINFLANLGWKWDEIRELLFEWNDKNEEPLRERYIEYQIEWHKKIYEKGQRYLPPNCANESYYKDMGVCTPDDICKLIKNPISYPYKKFIILKRDSKEEDERN